MGFGINAQGKEVNEEYANACNNIAQAHLVQQVDSSVIVGKEGVSFLGKTPMFVKHQNI